MEKCFRNGKSKDDTEYNCKSNFQGFETLGSKPYPVAGNQVINRIVDAGARHQCENPGEQINGGGIFPGNRKGTGKQCQDKGGCKTGSYGVS